MGYITVSVRRDAIPCGHDENGWALFEPGLQTTWEIRHFASDKIAFDYMSGFALSLLRRH